ncbi:hypothetical protein ACC806_34735 [Rhizobium ruizarguesonis]
MKIEVHHHDQIGFTHVATVDVPDHLALHAALEYAWRWTNNVDGSWSIKQRAFEDGRENGDFNARVEVIAPLRVDRQGKTWGHRSSMMGDVFIVDGKRWVVATFGFEAEDLRA